MATEPPPSRWEFPPVDRADDQGLLALGGDLEPGTLLSAYRHGCFPMPASRADVIGWWSPDPRGVIEPADLVVSRSLRRSLRRFELKVDHSFEAVVRRCADPGRPGGWITPDIVAAYCRLHDLGWAHSVESWRDGELVGGLYGVSIGAFFAGESMFSLVSDASKVALVHLVRAHADLPGALVDVQWITEHLASLGATTLSRTRYLERLAIATADPGPSWLLIAAANRPR